MNNPNNQIDNRELLEAIDNMIKNRTEENTSIFLDFLINAQFIIPIAVPIEDTVLNEDGSRTLKKDSNISLKSVTNMENDEYLVVFSDWQQVKDWNEDEDEGVILDFPSLAETISSKEEISGFVINPFSTNFVMDRNKVAVINDSLDFPTKDQQ